MNSIYQSRNKNNENRNNRNNGNQDFPMVSVITIVLNDEKSIEKTILSIISQSYFNYEYIIIDGGSEDSTIDIIRYYEKHIDFWLSEPDEGIYSAMNKGILRASGKYSIFINSGDVLSHKNILRKIFQKLDSSTDIFYGNTIVDFGSFTRCIIPKKLTRKDAMPFCHQSALVRTALLKEKRFDVHFKICADRDFFTKCYYEEKSFCYIDTTIAKIAAMGYSSINSVLHIKEKNTIALRYRAITILESYINILIITIRFYIIKIIPSKLRLFYHKSHVL